MSLKKLEKLFTKLKISNKMDTVLESYNTIIENEKIISLDLIRCGITELKGNEFDPFQSLRNLYLSHNDIGTLPNDLFSDLKELIHLDLRGIGLRIIPEDLFKNQYKLKRLELNDNYIKYLPPNLFDNLYSLVELNLSNNKLKTLHAGMFDNLGHLERFYLYFNEDLPPNIANGDYYDRESVEEVIDMINKTFSEEE